MNGGEAVNAAHLASSGRRGLLLLLLVGVTLFGWRLGSHDLWPPDEPRFALVAREMWESGDPVVLSVNHALYTDKPPLFFWAIDGFAWLLGGRVDEWAARLPSAVSALASLFLVSALGTGLFDRRTGILAALIFATSPQIAERARWASIDMTLNLFVLGAILLLVKGGMGKEPARGAIRCAYVLMGFATLAKGPVGFLLPLMAVLPALLLMKDFAAVRRIAAPSGPVLLLLVTLAWLVPWAVRLGGARAALQIVWHQTGERYLNAWNGQHPVWYYLWQFPLNFAPWIVFFPGAVAHAFSKEERDRRREALFLVTWIGAIFLFFSFSTGKRALYIIPLYPAASLLVGRLFSRAAWGAEESARTARRRLAAPLVLWAGVALALAAGLPLAARRRFPDLVPAAAALGVVLFAGALGALRSGRSGRPERAAGWLVGSMAAAGLLVVGAMQPWIDRYENLSGFAAQVKAVLRPEVRFGTTEQKREAWVFYTGRAAEELDTDESVLTYLARPGPRDLLIEEAKLAPLRDRLPRDLVEVARGRVTGQPYFLLRREAAR